MLSSSPGRRFSPLLDTQEHLPLHDEVGNLDKNCVRQCAQAPGRSGAGYQPGPALINWLPDLRQAEPLRAQAPSSSSERSFFM